MNFEEVLDQALARFQRRGRITYRPLIQFELDDDRLKALKGECLFAYPELTSAKALALYDPDQHRHLVYQCGEDPRYESLYWLVLVNWMLGYPEAVPAPGQ